MSRKRWKHIEEVFVKEKEKLRDNPFVDLAENFARCFDIITNSRVVSGFPEEDKLNMNLYSADRLVNYSQSTIRGDQGNRFAGIPYGSA